jgi:hypothetical protein
VDESGDIIEILVEGHQEQTARGRMVSVGARWTRLYTSAGQTSVIVAYLLETDDWCRPFIVRALEARRTEEGNLTVPTRRLHACGAVDLVIVRG